MSCQWYLLAWERAFDISGRSRRKEYWTFSLINTLILILLEVVCIASDKNGEINVISRAVILAFLLVSLIPTWTGLVRRLHDTNKSAWWLLYYLVPLIGPVVIFVVTLFDSDPALNRYGEDPKCAPAN